MTRDTKKPKLEIVSDDPLLWNVRETLRQLGGISRRTLERLPLAPVHIGSRVMYRPDEVRAYIRDRAA